MSVGCPSTGADEEWGERPPTVGMGESCGREQVDASV